MTDDAIEFLLEHWSALARVSRLRFGHCGSAGAHIITPASYMFLPSFEFPANPRLIFGYTLRDLTLTAISSGDGGI